MIVISEPGVYRLVFRSRKPEAERFKRWLAHDVLPVLRKTGSFALPSAVPDAKWSSDGAIPENHLYRLYVIREARQLFGPERARALWHKLGLPPVPPPPPTAHDESMMCLRHLLDSPSHEGGPAIRGLLELALDDLEAPRLELLAAGIRVFPDRDAFMVANETKRLGEIFKGTAWERCHGRVLRRLNAVQAAGPFRFQGVSRRGCLIPGTLLDDEAPDTIARRVLRS